MLTGGIDQELDAKSRGQRFLPLQGKLLYNPKGLKAGSIGGVEYGSALKYVSLSTDEIFDEKPDAEETVEKVMPEDLN